MKAVLRKILDETGLGGKMVLGVHDTDYFAKVNIQKTSAAKYELLPHNDGATKDLWSAAGEISSLFGSETFPTRHDLVRYHVPIDRLAKATGKERLDLINEATEAWGWRGLVYNGSRDLIVHCLTIQELGEPVQKMLQWGLEGTRKSLVEACCREEAQQTSDTLLSWIQDFRSQYPNQFLTRLYQTLFPKLLELLLGSPLDNFEVDCTAHMLRLSPETASLPRFEFVDLFLNEKTRSLAFKAYNDAVAGSEIYTLDKFGLGALPFDIVTPELGRGTLRVTLRAVHIETSNPIRIPLSKPINSIQELAEVLCQSLGDHVTLVGKAVALISMLAREFIFSFNEEGSGYVTRTLQMNNYLRAAGIIIHQHPILRLKFDTWDSLSVASSSLVLPEHLANSFGTRQIPSADFAARWKSIVAEQKQILSELHSITSPRAFLSYMIRRQGSHWNQKLEAYDQEKEALKRYRAMGVEIQTQVDRLYVKLKEVKKAIETIQLKKGTHFRSVTEWTSQENDQRLRFTEEVSALLDIRRELLSAIQELKSQRFSLERGAEVTAHRQIIDEIEIATISQRLQMLRVAILTASSLEHTNHRPSAWWLPMVDPTGGWFNRIAETTEIYTQPL